MNFNVGDKVFHPLHGAGVIKSITEMEILQKLTEYYVIDLNLAHMDNFMIPVANALKIGLRTICNRQKVQNIKEILMCRNCDELVDGEVWNIRYKESCERAVTGNLFDVAYVLKTLYARSKVKPLGIKENDLMKVVKNLLISEFSMVMNLDDDEAKEEIEGLLKYSDDLM